MKKLIILALGVFAFLFSFSQSKQSPTKSRSAKTGQYVKKDYAKKHPATTVNEKTNTKSSTRKSKK